MIDSYSAFHENDRKTPAGLTGYLRERGLTRIFLAALPSISASATRPKTLTVRTLLSSWSKTAAVALMLTGRWQRRRRASQP